MKRTYIAIDLKSFYASVECVERHLDPLDTLLVVADESRTDKTICLAASPAIKAYGVSGRARLFEVKEAIRKINEQRKQKAPRHRFTGESTHDPTLKMNPSLALSCIIAPPQMEKYERISAKVYEVYLRYIAPEDIHVYSIDEVFMDVTDYLHTYEMDAHELAMKMILDVLSETGITATAGIGENLYLCKVAMDIMAKHVDADMNGVRIAELNKQRYREALWEHTPITDFWRVGNGYAKRLAALNLFTMGDIALFSSTPQGEDKLYETFGINAELLIDHAWGEESCTMQDIKNYRPDHHSLGIGQVLKRPYSYEETKTIVKEMAESLSLDLVDKHLVTNQLVLTIGYDQENTTKHEFAEDEMTIDRYGRKMPKHAHGTIHLSRCTASTKLITKALLALYDDIVFPYYSTRRVTISALDTKEETQEQPIEVVQYDLFHDARKEEMKRQAQEEELKKEKALQETTLAIKKKYGKNALLKGLDLMEEATSKERNEQIGGHQARKHEDA